jgi:hypothetical protein
LSIAFAATVIRARARGRFFNLVDASGRVFGRLR